MDKIKYRDGYKYQLAEDYNIAVPIYPPADIDISYVRLTAAGRLTIRAGYAWDGASGPTIDTDSSMVGALVHDALCQLMRERLLDLSWFKKVNEVAHDLWIKGGMFAWRAWLWKRAIDSDLARATALKVKKEYTAP